MVAWISEYTAHTLAVRMGSSLKEWLQKANSRNFQPENLVTFLRVSATFSRREFNALNLIAIIAGTEHPEERIREVP